ncbi:16S rRNA m(2)G 1207 methyltransferase [Rhodobacter aestuarii]|uniref:16S rRNA m(2)G 1207 methyltransferase n=1 Tax=Rhodobacter aestuarii TaxID=453582 RepID=A0A1N7PMD0_9RHOB|nr:class I SAM-dependent methyltransferase [Rhodobacter aestuarii]PTV94302.1 16S rRNA m(2)G 1207 methyltransferase [Rhodobacter aestuarii]SIT11680.1 16S rRNA m(2)G 1207 methyltransferase [Rhodobacter aestuarii]
MSHTRLSLALDAPEALPVEGRIAVFRPTAESDLSLLPKERLHLIQGFRPDYDALTARGYTVSPAPEGSYAGAVVFLPRAKAEARALLAAACEGVAPGGVIWVDGMKTDGIDSVIKDVRAHLEISDPIAKAHGKIFSFSATSGALAAWAAKPMHPAEGFTTLPGVFSADGVDRGSALLAACLPEHLPAKMIDLGAGWGWLSAQVLAREGVESLDLVEAEHSALECSKMNISDPRARFIWGDVTHLKLENRPTGAVMNPPFHTSRTADPALGAAFIRSAAGLLSLSGTLWMVANRHLPYEAVLRETFHEVHEITPPTGRDGAFRIFRAERPIAHATKSGAAVQKPVSAPPKGRRVARTRR